MKLPKYMVCTICATYNHAPYIVDALNGFCMQETSFPVVSVIIDDASQDEEQEVIKTYLQDNFDLKNKEIVRQEETDDYNLIFAQHKTNKCCYFAVLFLKYNHYSIRKDKRPYYAEWEETTKYVAFCEGDDYWTDPHKLQKQVDFLDAHPEFVFACHRYCIFDTMTQSFSKDYGCKFYTANQDLVVTHELQSKIWVTKTLSMVIRAHDYITASIKTLDYYGSNRDTFFIYELLNMGDGISLNQNMGVYRLHSGGIWTSQNYRERNLISYNENKQILTHHPDDTLIMHRVQKFAIYNACCSACWNHNDMIIFNDSMQYLDSFSLKAKAYIALLTPYYFWLIIRHIRNIFK